MEKDKQYILVGKNIKMEYISICLITVLLGLSINAKSQNQEIEVGSVLPLELSKEAVVPEFKDNLKLTLFIDTIIVGQKKINPNFKAIIGISTESDYIRVNDSLYLKIFISRRQENGKKFYSWRWDYLKLNDGKYSLMGSSSIYPMEYNGGWFYTHAKGEAVGPNGTSDYLMYYYRYKLE